jgi:hypothetical protein
MLIVENEQVIRRAVVSLHDSFECAAFAGKRLAESRAIDGANCCVHVFSVE